MRSIYSYIIFYYSIKYELKWIYAKYINEYIILQNLLRWE